jgi:hypothetical protein
VHLFSGQFASGSQAFIRPTDLRAGMISAADHLPPAFGLEPQPDGSKTGAAPGGSAQSQSEMPAEAGVRRVAATQPRIDVGSAADVPGVNPLSAVGGKNDRPGSPGRSLEDVTYLSALPAGITAATTAANAQALSGSRSTAPIVSGSVPRSASQAHPALTAEAFPVSSVGGIVPAFVSHEEMQGSLIEGKGEAGAIAEMTRSPFQVMDATPGSVHEARGSVGGLAAGGSPSIALGYQDPSLGYVEVHAHLSGDGVHASLQAVSPESGAALESHLHALAGWMSNRQTPVESLTVLTSSMGNGNQHGQAAGHAAGNAAGNDSNAGGHGQAQQGRGKEIQRQSTVPAGEVSAAPGPSQTSGWRADGIGASLAAPGERMRSSISVIA